MYASLITMSALVLVAVVSAAVVPPKAFMLGNSDFTTCKAGLMQSMTGLDACKFFNATWYIAAYDNTWLNDIMNMGGMSCMNYVSSCYTSGNVNTTLNFGMGNPQMQQYNPPTPGGLWMTPDGMNVLAVLDTDYMNYGVIGGCNNKTGSYWNVLSRGPMSPQGLAWVKLRNAYLVGANSIYNTTDDNSKLADNSGCSNNPPNSAVQITAISGLIVSMLAVLSAWIMS